MNKKRSALAIISGCIVLVLFILAVSFGGLEYRKYFEPKHKAIDREVWENTPSRIHGATQEISKRFLEYQKTQDIEEKQAICNYLRTAYSNLDVQTIDDYTLRIFFKKCKYEGIKNEKNN